ncbi:MAG: hypothetical protein HY321_17750 [Armatimonadetes bacterium]|nr:hypothetical protein [Armatimonadota bacterium]
MFTYPVSGRAARQTGVPNARPSVAVRPRCWFFLPIALLWLLPARAAREVALPEGIPAVSVTLTAVETPDRLLAQIARITGVRLAAEEHVATLPVTLGAHECPLADLMAGLAEMLELTWRADGRGGFVLCGPVVDPPLMDTTRLIGKLAGACPPGMRPPLTGPPTDTLVPPLPAVFASLPRALRDTVEEGGSVPFAALPPALRALLQEYRRPEARNAAAAALNPRWRVPPHSLALQPSSSLGMLGAAPSVWWMLVVRPPAPAGETATAPRPPSGWAPARQRIYWYPGFGPGIRGGVGADAWPLTAAALEVVKRTGVSVLLMERAGRLRPLDPQGDTPEAMLDSLLVSEGKSDADRYVWTRRGRVYSLGMRRPPQVVPAEVQRAREILEEALPSEYRPLFAMTSGESNYAVGGAWARFWQSLTREQRAPAKLLVAAALSPEQQRRLYTALQLGMVRQVWEVVRRYGPSGLEGTALSLNFDGSGKVGGAWSQTHGLGFPRQVRLTSPEADAQPLQAVLEDQPPILRLLPTEVPALRRTVDFQAKDEPLADVTVRLAGILKAPVMVREPREEIRLTGEFRGRPLRLVLHWIEWRTGLQWSQRGGSYVLAPPVPPAVVTGEVQRALEALAPGIRLSPSALSEEQKQELALAEQREREAREAVLREGLGPAERAVLAAAPVPVTRLHPDVQDALREEVRAYLQRPVAAVRDKWETLLRLGEANVRIRRWEDGHVSLYVTVPGLAPQSFDIWR